MPLQQYRKRIDSYIANILPKSSAPDDLAAAMHYSVLNPGKRLRPALVYATGEMLNVPLEALDAPAAAIELIHCYSMIHDDLPAMDDDDLRRGKPTCHKAFSEAMAILAGDALLTLAFEILADQTLNPIHAQQQINQIKVLANAAGAHGMVLGQALDIQAENQQVPLAHLQKIHSNKTGQLFKACILMAQQASDKYTDVDVETHLINYAQNLGLLFQIQDDILDVTSDDETLGKPVGSDIKLGKNTYPSLMGIENAKEYAKKTLNNAIAALNTFGNSGIILHSLAEFALTRSK